VCQVDFYTVSITAVDKVVRKGFFSAGIKFKVFDCLPLPADDSLGSKQGAFCKRKYCFHNKS